MAAASAPAWLFLHALHASCQARAIQRTHMAHALSPRARTCARACCVQHLSPSLGVEVAYRDYGDHCALLTPDGRVAWSNLRSTLLDEFVIAHSLGWWAKALLLRNTTLLWMYSVSFELMEATFAVRRAATLGARMHGAGGNNLGRAHAWRQWRQPFGSGQQPRTGGWTLRARACACMCRRQKESPAAALLHAVLASSPPQHMLPNFNECWWDSWLLDVAICNSLGARQTQRMHAPAGDAARSHTGRHLRIRRRSCARAGWLAPPTPAALPLPPPPTRTGIYAGMASVRWLECTYTNYNWQGISELSGLLQRASRGLQQLLPYSWTKLDWMVFSSERPQLALPAAGTDVAAAWLRPRKRMHPCSFTHSVTRPGSARS